MQGDRRSGTDKGDFIHQQFSWRFWSAIKSAGTCLHCRAKSDRRKLLLKERILRGPAPEVWLRLDSSFNNVKNKSLTPAFKHQATQDSPPQVKKGLSYRTILKMKTELTRQYLRDIKIFKLFTDNAKIETGRKLHLTVPK